MIRILFFVFIYFLPPALCSECVRYTFEEDYETLFKVCDPTNPNQPEMLFWNHGNYDSIDVTGQHDYSSAYISPQPGVTTSSCVSSFPFSMAPDGIIEVIAYMENVGMADLIGVMAYQITDEDDVDRSVGTVLLTPAIQGSFQEGWHRLRMTLTSSTTSDGYLSFMGSAAQGSIVLVDSFRYIPPGYDEDLCEIYPTTTTTKTTTTKTTTTITTTTTPVPVTTTEESVPVPEENPTSPCPPTSEPVTPPLPTPTTSFWNPLTITMVVLLWIIFLALICKLFYELGKKRRKAANALQNGDIESIPPSLRVPRVKRVYPDVNVNPYANGKV